MVGDLRGGGGFGGGGVGGLDGELDGELGLGLDLDGLGLDGLQVVGGSYGGDGGDGVLGSFFSSSSSLVAFRGAAAAFSAYGSPYGFPF